MSLEAQSFKCSCCPYVFKEHEIDFATKRAICPKCESVTVFTRRQINGSKQVSYDVENAIKFFEENNFETAKRYAESALSASMDNAVALFILAYYNAYHAPTKNQTYLDKFFKESLKEIDVDFEEMESLKPLLLKRVLNLYSYEKYILEKILQTQKSKEIAAFVEEFSPYTINKRGSIDWFDSQMVNIYVALTEKASIPKTWFALYKQISENPDSPEKTDTFYLKTKAKRFFEDYVCNLEKIFAKINDTQWKDKFVGGLAKKKQFYLNKLEN